MGLIALGGKHRGNVKSMGKRFYVSSPGLPEWVHVRRHVTPISCFLSLLAHATITSVERYPPFFTENINWRESKNM